MDIVFVYIVASVFIISLISLVGVLTLFFKKKTLEKSSLALVSFSVGALLGAAFLDLIPEAIEAGGETASVFALVLLGLLVFFVLEKVFYWRHCHEGKCEVHTFTYLNLFGDGMHNFFDGMVVAASFMTSVPLGIATSVAIIAHEIPQEIGDFAVLVYGGMSRKKALAYNFLTALTAVLGALIVYFLGIETASLERMVLPFAAGGFIYISSVDLIPEIHKERDLKKSAGHIALLVFGVLVIYGTKLLFEH